MKKKEEIPVPILLDWVCHFAQFWIQPRFLLYFEGPVMLDDLWDKYQIFCSEHNYDICDESEFDIILNCCGLDWTMNLENGDAFVCEAD